MIFLLFRLAFPLLFFGSLFWVLFGRSGGPRQRRWSESRGQWQPDQSPGPVSSSQSSAAQQTSPLPRSAELPIDVQVKVEQIRRKAEVLLGFASRFPPFSRDMYVVRQSANEYLLQAIDAYLAVPPVNRDQLADGHDKTALQELKDQLALLDATLNEIAEDLQRQDLGRLLANRQFLEGRLGRTSA
jgi:hypothetical protein